MPKPAQTAAVHSDLVATGIVRTVEHIAATQTSGDRLVATMTLDEAFSMYLWGYERMLAAHHPALLSPTNAVAIPRVAEAQQFLASIRSTPALDLLDESEGPDCTDASSTVDAPGESGDIDGGEH